jgi:LPS-assembly lipoprotein
MRLTVSPVFLLVAILMNSCGFQLRGQVNLPPALAVTYIKTNGPIATSEVGQALQQALEANKARITADPAAATGTITLLSEEVLRRTTATNPTGDVREYQLTYRVVYTVTKADGTDLIANESLSVSQNLLYPQAQILGQAAGEDIMLRSMASDISWSIIRRLEAIAS